MPLNGFQFFVDVALFRQTTIAHAIAKRHLVIRHASESDRLPNTNSRHINTEAMNKPIYNCLRALTAILGIAGTLTVTQAQTNTIAVGVPTGAQRSDAYPGIGYEFYAPVAGTSINALGYWDASGTGLLAPHTVSVYKYSGGGSSYNLVVTATIPAGTNAPLINGYRWVSIPTTALPNNGQGGGYYAVLAEHNLDTWADTVGSAPYMNSAIGTVSGFAYIGYDGRTVLTPTMNINGSGNPNEGWAGPNLGFITNSLPAAASAPVITWAETGAFTDSSVLSKVGAVSNVVYGVDFGGSGLQTTANGYAFDDYATSGNATLGGSGFGFYDSYLSGGGTTGDAAFDSVLNFGAFGGVGNYCVLNNLTPGQKYNVLALAVDTRPSGSGVAFQETDYLTYSPAQQYGFNGGTPSVGGYIKGTFTAAASNQLFSMISAHIQYNAILLAKWTPPIDPDIVVVTNPQPANLTVGAGGQVTYTAAFSNSPAVNVQWLFITNGVTNTLSSGIVNTVNGGLLVSSLTLSNLQVANSGSYQAKATDATNSLNFKFTTAVTLQVNTLIEWVHSGTFSDNTVLGLVGNPTNVVYGLDFGGAGLQTTANGYTFDDYINSGNMDLVNFFDNYNNYLNGVATTGDSALDATLNYGAYGLANMTGTLKNLTVGQTYFVLVLLADCRGNAAGGSVVRCSDGVLLSPAQQMAFENGTPSVGGYLLGRFTAQSTVQPLTVYNNYPYSCQYNAVLVAKTSAPTNPPIFMTSDISPGNATVGQGVNVSFTASFRNNPAVTIQWQSVIGGATNNISTGVVTTNIGADVVTTLTLSNVQTSASGTYRVRASNATNSANSVSSSFATLSVVPVITWTASGAFSDNSVLALVGSPSDVFYAADFGGSGSQTTANGYTFDDGIATGNVSLSGHSDYNAYMSGETSAATTGDPALDAVLNYGAFGSGGTSTINGTLHNLTPGQKYNILVLLDDTRGAGAGFSVFAVNDGLTTSANIPYAFTNGLPSVGGYLLGSITPTSSDQDLSVWVSSAPTATFYLYFQYNAIIVAKAAAVAPTAPVLAAPAYSGGNIILTGTGGTPNASYTWLQTTNLTVPINWTTNTIGTLNGAGALSNAIPVNVSQPGGLFLRLRLP